MPVHALALVLLSAAIHAGWNAIVKGATHRLLIAWWSLIIIGVVGLPYVIVQGGIASALWLRLGASALAEAAYFWALVRAYDRGDFAVVYPVARGSAPALVTLGATLFLGDRIALLGGIGVAFVVAGILTIGGIRRERYGDVARALLVSVMIATYSVIDASAARMTSPVPYVIVVFLCTGVLLAPALVWRYRASLWSIGWNERRSIAVVSLGQLLGYSLVLMAFGMAPVAYVGALREISVVLAVAIAWRWLGERPTRHTIAGALLVVVGAVCVALVRG